MQCLARVRNALIEFVDKLPPLSRELLSSIGTLWLLPGVAQTPGALDLLTLVQARTLGVELSFLACFGMYVAYFVNLLFAAA